MRSSWPSAIAVAALSIATATAQPPVEPIPPAESSTPPEGEETDEDDPLQGSFELAPRIALIINTSYGTRGVLPGPFALFAVPPRLEGDQFVIATNNTTLGFAITGVTFGRFEIEGGVDVNLKSASPLASPNVLSPQFYDASIGAYADNVILRFGQFPDVLLPFVLPTANGWPGSYLPGQLGFFRPQIRLDMRLASAERAQLVVETSLARPIQTLEVADELLGVQAGIPDLQARLELGFGAEEASDATMVRWRRPYELGIGGHAGRRKVLDLSGDELAGVEVDSWSIGVDLRAELPWRTSITARLWTGSVLGDYAAGVFQTVSTDQLTPVHATGFVVTGTQAIGGGWRLGAGFGRDDPDDADLGPGERVLNQAAFGNLFWQWSRRVGFALEGSRWQTQYKARGSTRAWRGEIMAIIRM